MGSLCQSVPPLQVWGTKKHGVPRLEHDDFGPLCRCCRSPIWQIQYLKLCIWVGPIIFISSFLPISLGEDLKKRSSQRKKKSSGLACNWSSLINHQRLVHWEQLIHQHYQKNKFVVFWVVKKNGCFSVGGSISIEQQASNQMIGKLHGGGMERGVDVLNYINKALHVSPKGLWGRHI